MSSQESGPNRVGSAHASLSQAIAEEIKSSILDGVYQPGQRLIEETLAEEMGVSRNPVREALRDLEDRGFVEIAPRKGAWVAKIDESEAADLFQVRAALEALSARLAARLAGPSDIGRLAAIVDKGDAAVADRNVEDLPGLNSEFHSTVASIAGNAKLESMILSLRDQIHWIYARHVRERAVDSWGEHRRLFEAIRDGDEEAAAHTALDHISAAEQVYLRGASDHASP